MDFKTILLVVLALAALGECNHNRGKKKGHHKKDTLRRFGLTKAEIKSLVDDHNKWRKKVKSRDMRKLVWDDDLATDAMNWAQACYWGHGQPSKPAFKAGYAGQNLGYSTRYSALKNRSFTLWVEEADYYNATSDYCYFAPCGHYTQLMWSRSKKIGCAFHICDEMYSFDSPRPVDRRAKYLVCNYFPQGNINGQRPWTSGDESCKDCHYCVDNLCVDRETCMNDTDCVCKKECQHCGTLTSECRCECPDGTHGEECEYLCRDKKVECDYFSNKTCKENTSTGKVVRDFCDALCGNCKLNTNTSWTCGNETYNNTFVRYASPPQYGYRNKDGSKCAFPFRHRGKYHDKCIEEDGKTWCSPSTDNDIYATRGYGCKTIGTTEGNANGTDCVLPFKYNGMFYQTCLFDRDSEKYWCGTTEDFDADGKYGYCDLNGIE